VLPAGEIVAEFLEILVHPQSPQSQTANRVDSRLLGWFLGSCFVFPQPSLGDFLLVDSSIVIDYLGDFGQAIAISVSRSKVHSANIYFGGDVLGHQFIPPYDASIDLPIATSTAHFLI